MAAPSGTVWGSAVGSGWVQSRLGIYKSVSTTSTSATVTVQIWFWSKSSVTDQYNDIYYNCLSTTGSATTNRGNVSIKTTNYDNGGSGWATSNQVKLKTFTHTYTRGTAAIKRYVYAKLNTVEYAGGISKVSTTFTVPALASYTVKYNANGGTGAPASQTKYYGKTLTLRTGTPSRTGYDFLGWSKSSTDTSFTSGTDYKAGGSYSANASVTLYAIWKKKTYPITYKLAGGSGTSTQQTKTYGTALTLHGAPTKASTTTTDEEGVISQIDYTFVGWEDLDGTVYEAKGSYTKNKENTLTALWRSSIEPITYPVNYDIGDGEGYFPTQQKEHGVSLTLSGVIPWGNESNFEYWLGSDGKIYYPRDAYTTDALITLTAVYTPWSHTVTFDSNGGLDDVPSDFVKTKGVDIVIENTIPTREGYTFKCWNSNEDGTGSLTYKSGDSYIYSQNGGTVTLYAIWSRNGIVINQNGSCEAREFIEDGEHALGTTCFGDVYAREIIEGSAAKIGENSFIFTEFIEI